MAILASVLLYHREQDQLEDGYVAVRTALAELHEQALLQGALYQSRTGYPGFPRDISAYWFVDNQKPDQLHWRVPVNAMVPTDYPWIDVAPAGDMSEHPPDPIITRSRQAGFWYNPNRGVFRARVMPQVSEQHALRLYNRLNETALASMPRAVDPGRRPRAVHLEPGVLVSSDPSVTPR